MKEGNGKGRIARPTARPPNGGEETIHHLFPPSLLTPPTPTPIKIRHDFSPMPLAPVRSAAAARMREGPSLSRAAWRR